MSEQKRQMTMEQSFAVKAWIESNADFAKSAESVSQVSIKASEDLGWPVSPSSIRSVMAALKMERAKPQKKSLTITEGLDRAEFDQLKRDVATLAHAYIFLSKQMAMSDNEIISLGILGVRERNI